MPKKKPLLPTKLSDAKVIPWQELVPNSVLPLEKGAKAGVIVDRQGIPRMFVFDTAALLEVLSTIDEQLADRLSAEDYHSKEVNPTGWLIDEIEGKLPLDKQYIQSLKDAITEAKQTGWIPLETIERELHFT